MGVEAINLCILCAVHEGTISEFKIEKYRNIVNKILINRYYKISEISLIELNLVSKLARGNL